MVVVQAARKTGAYMILSSILALSVVTFMSGALDPTARVVSDGVAGNATGSGWLFFTLGIFTGALLVGTYVYVAHIEAKREE